MATTLLEYLTEPNPNIDSTRSLEGPPTKIEPKEDIMVIDWEDFTHENLITSPPVQPIECEIFDEDSLDHLLTRSVVSLVNESLKIAWGELYPEYSHLAIDMTRGGRARGSVNIPSVPRLPDGAQEPSQNTDEGPSFPDWAGVQIDPASGAYINRCPGDTKLSTKWGSVKDKRKGHYYWPYAQLIKYCGENWNTRYGYLITQEELVVLRISRSMIPSGIAMKRSPRKIVAQSSRTAEQGSTVFVSSSPPAIRSPIAGSSAQQSHMRHLSATSVSSAMSIDQLSVRPRRTSITTSLASLSMSEASDNVTGSDQATSSVQVLSSQSYKDDGMGGEYRPVEMKSIPWSNSGPGKLTVKLALWWIHMMAAAPGCDITVGPGYPALDSWVLRDGVYHHITTGIVAKKLPGTANIISPRQASRGPVTPPRQWSSPNSSPSNWLARESRWQFRTVDSFLGRMRDGTPVWSRDRQDWYYARLKQGKAQWATVDSDDQGTKGISSDGCSEGSDESMSLPQTFGKNRKR
ncbi:hypothetical protein FQN49_001665 [Arthroderma sp. PD_2]|nr:hypothetical protein FQN49_001665 [Arthroderma sp. PD_2]